MESDPRETWREAIGRIRDGGGSAATVGACVLLIASVAHDDETAHGLEDELHRAVLERVAAGDGSARVMAEAALKTYEIDFARWCA